MKQFVYVPIKRGFNDIKTLFQDAANIGAFICGGYARYCASPNKRPVKSCDIDIYCKNEKVFNAMKDHLILNKKLEMRKESDVAILFKKHKKGVFKKLPPIQLIKPILQGRMVARGTIRTILSNFDFSVIRCAIVSPTEVLVDCHFERDETKKFLRIKNIHCPISSTLRFCKYYKKKYHTSPKQILLLFKDWDARPKDYKDRLIKFLETANNGEGLTRKDVEVMERMMRID